MYVVKQLLVQKEEKVVDLAPEPYPNWVGYGSGAS